MNDAECIKPMDFNFVCHRENLQMNANSPESAYGRNGWQRCLARYIRAAFGNFKQTVPHFAGV
mgnify:CR=1 FL=1